jgi:hypothetical protein
MGRTWMLRGSAVSVVAVLGCAWAAGVVSLGGSAAPAAKHTTTESHDRPAAVHFQHGSVLERATPARRTHQAKTENVAFTEPTEPALVDPTDAPSSTSTTPPAPGQTHSPSGPTGGSGGGGASIPQPTHDPGTPSPSDDPSQGCSQLSQVLGCVLAPITSHP